MKQSGVVILVALDESTDSAVLEEMIVYICVAFRDIVSTHFAAVTVLDRLVSILAVLKRVLHDCQV